MKSNRLLAASAALAALLLAPAPRAGAQAPAPAATSVAALAPRPAEAAARDWAALARTLAGMAPGNPAFATTAESTGFKEHQAYMDKQWAEMAKERIEPVRKWRDEELKPTGAAAKTLLYPFAGPDFMNAYLFFPAAERFVFFGLEDWGKAPEWSTMSDKERADLLKDIRSALSGLFRRHYFITRDMADELHTSHLRGDLPILLVFLARMDCAVTGLEQIQVEPDGSLAPRGAISAASPKARPVPGIRIDFEGADKKARQLFYFAVDVSNEGLASRPGFLPYLRSLGQTWTFMKAASYLLHAPEFTHVRGAIVDDTQLLMQEDSGLPFKYLPAATWDVRLYGKYTKPIKDFNFGFQPDLDAAYKVPGAARPLPFRFGYHWKDGASNVQIAVRKTAQPPAPTVKP